MDKISCSICDYACVCMTKRVREHKINTEDWQPEEKVDEEKKNVRKNAFEASQTAEKEQQTNGECIAYVLILDSLRRDGAVKFNSNNRPNLIRKQVDRFDTSCAHCALYGRQFDFVYVGFNSFGRFYFFVCHTMRRNSR